MDILQIAIPTYDRSIYLDKLLCTIPKEIIVSISDNGCLTSSEVKDKHPNGKFIGQTEVLGVFKNWNSAVVPVDSEWVIIPSDDDIFLERSFEIIHKYLEKYSDRDMLIFGHKVVDEFDTFRPGWCPDQLMEFNAPDGYNIFKYGVSARMPSIVFKVSKLKELGYFDDRFVLTAGDSDLIQRILLTGNVVYIPELISAYRIWKGALTSQKIGSQLWLAEIDLWQNKIVSLGAESYKGKAKSPDFKRIKDEVYASNLIGGLTMLKKSQGIASSLVFLLKNRYPWHAGPGTHKNIIKSLFIQA